MKGLHMTAWVLVMIGGLNWLLIGLGGFFGGNWDVVWLLLGSWPAVQWLVYIVIGLAAVYEIVTHRKNCKTCTSGSAPMM
ncbi:MAG TPA: DUF378 domain-containing protein [Candidatus Paceibacterota bacterium]|jgi:hypothetical protein|nr:DUF378 domain-containing protein [Candidatus Paceibacterota bacterium]